MRFRRLLPLLVLALLMAPFGRAMAAETMPAHSAVTADHCDGMPAPESNDMDASADCMIACSVVTPADSPGFGAAPPTAALFMLPALPVHSGLAPEADPPPPRLS